MNFSMFSESLSWYFVRAVGAMSSGALIGQALIFIALPILTKLYDPESFGQFAIYTTWLSNLLVLMTGRYELALMLPENEKRASNLVVLALVINSIMGLLLMLVISVVASILAGWIHDPAMVDWFLWLPLALLLAGASQVFFQWNNRQRRDHTNVVAPIIRAIVMVITQIMGGYLGMGGIGLLIGHITGQLALLIAYAWHDMVQCFPWRKLSTWAGMKAEAKAYVKFPIITMPQTFIGGLQDPLCFMLVGILSGSWMIGLLGIMLRVIRMPAMLIGTAIAQIAYREMTALYHTQGNLAHFYLKLLCILCVLSLFPALLLVFFGQSLFVWVFGEVWRMAGAMAAVFSPYMVGYFLVTSLGMLPLVLGKQQVTFYFTVLSCLLHVGGLMFGWFIWQDIQLALYFIAALQSIFFIGYLGWLYRMAKRATLSYPT
ncbi:MAG: oligosaccharide flippase family protein [Neisseriales bacterium]|nr:MAG: oligosaccharide flippase family protein [Neisseriales bacterium]